MLVNSIAVQPGRKNFRERIHKRLKSSIWGEKKKKKVSSKRMFQREFEE